MEAASTAADASHCAAELAACVVSTTSLQHMGFLMTDALETSREIE
jgi:hypothetical protein